MAVDGLIQVQKPFVDGTQVQYAWDSMTIGAAQECGRRYQYWVIEGWQSKSPDAAIALVFGILFHKGVEIWERAKSNGLSTQLAANYAIQQISADPAFERLPTEDQFQEEKAKAAEDDEDDGISVRNSRVRTRYHLIRALVWYFEQYKADPCKTLQLANGSPAVEMSFRVNVGATLASGHQLILSGHLDRVVEFGDHLYVSDYKTTKSITSSWRRNFDLSHQMSGYTLAGKLALERPVAGVMIDGIALQVGGVKFARHFTDRLPSQLGEFVHNLELLARRFEDYAAAGYYPMNPSFCMFCQYKEVCARPPEVRLGFLNQWFERKPAWNPLASR